MLDRIFKGREAGEPVAPYKREQRYFEARSRMVRFAYQHESHGVNRRARRAAFKRARAARGAARDEAWKFAEELQRFKLRPARRKVDAKGNVSYVAA